MPQTEQADTGRNFRMVQRLQYRGRQKALQPTLRGMRPGGRMLPELLDKDRQDGRGAVLPEI